VLAFIDLVRDRVLSWTLIPLSLTAGLVAAYGRERHQGRAPAPSWWFIRLCSMPFLAILTVALVDQFGLNGSKTAFIAAMLAMMGYELIAILVDRGINRAKELADTVGAREADAKARPYHSIVDTDESGRAAAHIVPTPPPAPIGGEVGGVVGQELRSVFPPKGDGGMKTLLDSLDDDMSDVPGIG
jgi:hypothetical protein